MFWYSSESDETFSSISSESDDYDYEDVNYNGQVHLEELNSLRENINWEIEEQRRGLLNQLYALIKNWNQCPNLRDIFCHEEINWLLMEDVKTEDKFKRALLMRFAINTGYKDEPKIDKNGKPLLNRTTPIHIADRNNHADLVFMLFEIYDRFDVNYVDELGMTHFHVACKSYYCIGAVEKFLKFGQDPNCHPPPLHLTLNCGLDRIITARTLLRSGADPNFADEDGLTPLHIIMRNKRFGDKVELAKMIFKINDDKHQLVPVDVRDKFGRTPLYYAVADDVTCQPTRLLLDRGANPNSADVEGLTPLHRICQRSLDDNEVELFFKMCDEKHQLVPVDPLDNRSLTPLDYAVTSLLPNNVDFLSNRGADLSKFIFPTESDFDERCELRWNDQLRLASGALGVIEQLEKRGYELDQNDALTIMKLFAKYKLFEKSKGLEKCFHDEGTFAAETKKIFILPKRELIYDILGSDDKIKSEEEMEEDTEQVQELVKKTEESVGGPSLSLYDLILLRPEEAQKQLTYSDYYSFWYWLELLKLPEEHNYRTACEIHLCEKLSRGFFRRWTVYPFWELIHYRLPLECCDMIIKQLTNEDLYHIVLAVTGQSLKDSKKI
ncbi:unnamed protein product [Trichogramma brassicae]|uniref:Uncharacterized protein n=1 Tax=Trichogramma brassicae TaxID=86971 RepID=A0A6H5ICM6_9HYME|nr:unnamed protein product [Trichogramma brassicae]